jgi:hypothetical protein
MPSTYEPIATTTLGSAASSISFTSIDQTYTDLVIVASVRGEVSGHLYARWGNNAYDSGTNYSSTGMFGRRNGINTAEERGSERSSNFAYARLTPFTYSVPSATSTFGTVITHIQNYSNTTTHKTALARASTATNVAYAGTEAAVILWRSTSAINQIQFTIAGGHNFETGTTITLYGIKAA